jgi:hypothetical protein
MKLTKISLLTAGFFVFLALCSQNTYADGGHDRDDSRHRSQGGYYKHSRYYPKSYYYYKKIYFYPKRQYYYFYDVFPEKIFYYNWEKKPSVDNSSYLPITSIVNMASQGVPGAVIISEIERTKSRYQLDSETIAYLKQNGVTDAVIDSMLNTNR